MSGLQDNLDTAFDFGKFAFVNASDALIGKKSGGKKKRERQK